MQPLIRDITYYEGDSFTITINPRNSNHLPLDLTGINDPDLYFRIANIRGDDATVKLRGTCEIKEMAASGEDQPYRYLVCNLTPDVGDQIQNGYVYDIGYWNTLSTGLERTTLLTGTFKMMSQVNVPPVGVS